MIGGAGDMLETVQRTKVVPNRLLQEVALGVGEAKRLTPLFGQVFVKKCFAAT